MSSFSTMHRRRSIGPLPSCSLKLYEQWVHFTQSLISTTKSSIPFQFQKENITDMTATKRHSICCKTSHFEECPKRVSWTFILKWCKSHPLLIEIKCVFYHSSFGAQRKGRGDDRDRRPWENLEYFPTVKINNGAQRRGRRTGSHGRANFSKQT